MTMGEALVASTINAASALGVADTVTNKLECLRIGVVLLMCVSSARVLLCTHLLCASAV